MVASRWAPLSAKDKQFVFWKKIRRTWLSSWIVGMRSPQWLSQLWCWTSKNWWWWGCSVVGSWGERNVVGGVCAGCVVSLVDINVVAPRLWLGCDILVALKLLTRLLHGMLMECCHSCEGMGWLPLVVVGSQQGVRSWYQMVYFVLEIALHFVDLS